ncbi:MAG: rhodanese-like domain-containing protein [bacterium]
MTRKPLLILIMFTALGLVLGRVGAFAFVPKSLEALQVKIEHRYPDVKHISTQQFSELDHSKVVLFDVREKKEFAVSHIQGAIQVAPKIRRKQFLDQYGQLVKGKIVVFYCSVGQRSSRLADRVQKDLLEEGAASVYNLEGGIFMWHNQERPLYAGASRTDYVHPFSKSWGQLLERKDKISMQP